MILRPRNSGAQGHFDVSKGVLKNAPFLTGSTRLTGSVFIVILDTRHQVDYDPVNLVDPVKEHSKQHQETQIEKLRLIEYFG